MRIFWGRRASGRALSLRWRLQALLAAAVIPLAALLIFNAIKGWRHAAMDAERTALMQARVASGGLDTAVSGARQAATALALRVQDEAFDLTACTDYVRSVLAAEPRYVSAAVVAPDGRIWCHSDPNVAEPPRVDLTAPLNSPDVAIGDMTMDPIRGVPVLPVTRPYYDHAGRALGVALVTLNIQRLTDDIAAQISPAVAFAMVVDRRGIPMVRVPASATALAHETSAEIAAALKGGAPRVMPALTHDDRSFVAGLVPVDAAARDLVALAALDRATALGPAESALIRDLVAVAVVMIVALVAGWLVGRRLVERPIRSFVHAAQRRAAGDLSVRFPDPGAQNEFGRLGAALNLMTTELDRHVNQKSLMIREVQHRVMNSLHLLGAILHLHARQVENESARQHLNEARERVASISIVYRHLYESECVRSVDFGTVLRGFCEEAAHAYLDHDQATIHVDAEAVELPVEMAMNLALITHELITNAMKHAYGSTGGPLRVELRRDGDLLELAATDWGKGLPPGFTVERSTSLGMLVIQSLTRQLRGRLTVERLASGTRFAVVVVMPGAAGTVAAGEPASQEREPLVA